VRSAIRCPYFQKAFSKQPTISGPKREFPFGYQVSDFHLVPGLITRFPQVRVEHATRRAWRILARALRDEVAHVWHKHVAARSAIETVAVSREGSAR
jgi:hypothetical protein